MMRPGLRLGLMLALFAVSGCSAASGPSAPPADAPASPLVFEPPELDMGQVREGEKAVARLLVRNSGDAIENIVELTTSCGCSVAEPEQRIVMPGGFTTVTVSIDTFAKQNAVRKWVELTDAHGRKSRAILHLRVLENPHLQAGNRSIFSGQCAACHAEPARGKRQGPEIYAAVCAMCHGEDGKGGYAPALVGHENAEALAILIAQGTGSRHMPGFARQRGGPLSPEQIEALSRWLAGLGDSERR